MHIQVFLSSKKEKKQMKFDFKELSIDDTQEKISRLGYKKASQNSDIPINIINKNAYIFEEYLHSSINGLISSTLPIMHESSRYYTNL